MANEAMSESIGADQWFYVDAIDPQVAELQTKLKEVMERAEKAEEAGYTRGMHDGLNDWKLHACEIGEAAKLGFREGIEAALSVVEDFNQPSWSVWISKHGDKTLGDAIRALLPPDTQTEENDAVTAEREECAAMCTAENEEGDFVYDTRAELAEAIRGRGEKQTEEDA